MLMSRLDWGIDWDIARGPTPEGKTEDPKIDMSEHALVTNYGLRARSASGIVSCPRLCAA